MLAKLVSRSFVLLTASLVFVASLLLGSPIPVSAQCGTGQQLSSCVNCHQQQAAFSGNGDWHRLHAGKNTCVDCHGGNPTALDEAQAHLGIFANPLTDVYTNCHTCHPSEFQQRAGSFAAILHTTPTGLTAPVSMHSQPDSNITVVNEIVIQPENTSLPSTALDLPTILILSSGAIIALIFSILILMNISHQVH